MRQHEPESLFRKLRKLPDLGRAQQGQVIVLAALMLVSILGFVALSVDAGYLMSQKRGVQAAADGASMAADKAYQRNQISDIETTAYQYADDSGFPRSSNDVNVTAHDTYLDYDKCVEVEIQHDVTKFFVGAIYSGEWQVAADAIACTELVDQPYALIALNPNGDGIVGSGTSQVIINNGGAMSNADSNFCGDLDFIVAEGPIDSYGGIDICNGTNVQYDSINPAAGLVVDPYAGVPQPDCSTLPTIDDPAIVDIKSSDPEDIPEFQPGYYPDGITVKGTHNLTFAPGVYCFGDDLDGSSGSSNPQDYAGDDVLFFFEDPAELNLSGQGINVDFSGHPGYEDIMVFYEREPNCHDGEFRLLGNQVNVEGVFYAPCAAIHLSGNSGSSITGQITGAEIDLLGGSEIEINFVSSVDIKVPKVFLVE